MVDFNSNKIESKPRKKTMAESLEEAKTEGKLVSVEEDKDDNAVINVVVNDKSNKSSKKLKLKDKKVIKNQIQVQGDDFKNAKVDKHGIPVNINVPRHILEIAFIVKFNAAFKRHTALNILHTLEDDDIITTSKGGYVDFLWNKFRVTADGGLRKEYRYTEMLFVDALIKAHSDVAKDSESVIKNMLDVEEQLKNKTDNAEIKD